jgi:hypothetical protein
MSTQIAESDEQPSWKVQQKVGKGDHRQLTERVDRGWKTAMVVAEMGVRVRQSDDGLSQSVIWPQVRSTVELEEVEPIHLVRTIGVVSEVLGSLYC